MMMIVTRLHVVLVMVMVAAAVAMVNHCQAVWLPQSGRWGAHVSVVGASAARGLVDGLAATYDHLYDNSFGGSNVVI